MGGHNKEALALPTSRAPLVVMCAIHKSHSTTTTIGATSPPIASAVSVPRDQSTKALQQQQQDEQATTTTLLAALWPCALYFCCAFAMNILTKILLTTYQWRALYALGAIQNTFTMVSVLALLGVQSLWRKNASVEAPLPSSSVYLSDEKTRDIASWKLPKLAYVLKVMLPLVTLHVGNMILGFASMRVVNMPM